MTFYCLKAGGLEFKFRSTNARMNFIEDNAIEVGWCYIRENGDDRVEDQYHFDHRDSKDDQP